MALDSRTPASSRYGKGLPDAAAEILHHKAPYARTRVEHCSIKSASNIMAKWYQMLRRRSPPMVLEKIEPCPRQAKVRRQRDSKASVRQPYGRDRSWFALAANSPSR